MEIQSTHESGLDIGFRSTTLRTRTSGCGCTSGLRARRRADDWRDSRRDGRPLRGAAGGLRHLLDAAEPRIACQRMGIAQVDRKRDRRIYGLRKRRGWIRRADETCVKKCEARGAVYAGRRAAHPGRRRTGRRGAVRLFERAIPAADDLTSE